ncbi:Vicilin-like antimicrobial peptides 2-1 [Acorus gramineus]|uniref:Vicilin-like antimicrobial peptides 2-1 n=1 Tax=Acorus gramineus TaxID=55184 RepID=A0AAV9ATP1_ACOGR|nr:Vicilin-like antimicrobial peptides 2-1 [Acorus gramineus]
MGTKAAKPLLILLVLALASLAFCYQGEDPQRQLQQCEQQCRQSERGQREQSRCLRECREQYEQQQQQEEEREQRPHGGERDKTWDPREEFQECQQQCQQQHRHDQRQKGECQRRCEERYREQRRGSRGGERVDDDNETRDPREEFQQCQQQCQQQHRHDQRQMGECQRRCEERYHEQQQRERQEKRGGERGRGERNSEETEDPREEFQQCQQQCQHQHRHDQRQMGECQRRCEERYREQQRREQHEERRGERGRGERDSEETEDPREEFQQCQQQCQQQHQHDQRRMGECQRRCKERYQKQQEQEERETRRREGRERDDDSEDTRDPREEYLQCQQQCQQQHGRDRRRLSECQRRCEERYRGEHQQGNRRGEEEQEEREEQEGREGEGERDNPFFYGRESFVHRIRTQHGSVRVLQRFSKRSELLRGIDNYRLAILKANPNTFIIPNHWDAEAVFFVVQGRGTITMLREENRESHNLRVGDIMHVPAGTTTYLINNDNNQKLYIAKILQPISTPGQFETFFGVGGENPESFYKSFSTEVLEAAFNTRRDKLDRLFGQQRKGAIIRASEEQIRSMSHSTGGRGWPFHGESSKGPYNLFDKRPSQSNEHGQLFEACSEDYQQLRDLNMDVSFINISSGSMLALNYNSQATKMAMVVGGNGHIEMVCPHVSGDGGRSQQSQREKEQEQQHEEQEQKQQEEEEEEEEEQEGRKAQRGQRSVHYQRVSARLSPGTAFVVPAGHPIAIVSSGNENLRIVSFGANANNNKRFFLAGRNSIWNQMEREAKELSFGMASREVEEIIGAQRGTGFVQGPKERQRREKGQKALESILDFVGL